LLILFLSAAVWGMVGSAAALLSSITFHAPAFLAGHSWLTYGRLQPAGTNAMLYGFCVQAGLGVALWLLARLGKTGLALPAIAIAGAIFWNLGVTLGFLGILVGDSTGFEFVEFPRYAASVVFLGYLLLGVSGALTFHQRRERTVFVSQWFILAALFWFPWIFSSAGLLLTVFPVRGVAQSVIAWWYANNLLVVWLGLVGLAAVFYFVPKLLNRELHSHYLALLAFWVLLLAGSWGGIPNSAPVPAWMPAVSTVATVLTSVALLAMGLNVRGTLTGQCFLWMSDPLLRFFGFGVVAFILAGFMRIAAAVIDPGQSLQATWFASATTQLNLYGFFAMAMFGAVYFILPQLTATGAQSSSSASSSTQPAADLDLCLPKLARAHLWLSAVGILLVVVPLAISGILEVLRPNLPFNDIVNGTLPFLRVATLGDLFILLANVLFLANLVRLTWRYYRACTREVYALATADLRAAEVKP
jgi:cytochrome c oxidase cbb3-type subunit 1